MILFLLYVYNTHRKGDSSMILEFTIENFLSFKNKTTFSMLGDADNTHETNYVTWKDKKILKSVAIYGANASGKTNFFDALATLPLLVKKSNTLNVGDKLPIIPFVFDAKSKKEPSFFEIRMLIDDIKYVYGLKISEDRVYEEYLYFYASNRPTKIFDRTNTDEYTFSQKEEKTLREIAQKNTENKLFLATATAWNYEKTQPVYEFLTSLTAVNDIASLKDRSLMLYNEFENILKKPALEILKEADFNIEDYKILETSIPFGRTKDTSMLKKNYQVFFTHKNCEDSIDFDLESEGTKIMFLLLPFIIGALAKQSTIIIDELDKSLHPFLVQYIVEIFNSPLNECNSQLIFNTHDTNLLDLQLLRRDQIWFTEKDDETGQSDLYPLSDFSVRKVENIEKGYLLGRYGAIPFIRSDLKL